MGRKLLRIEISSKWKDITIGGIVMEDTINNVPLLMIFGMLFITIFGGWLRRRYKDFDFKQSYSKLFFMLENYELVGATLIGVALVLLDIFG